MKDLNPRHVKLIQSYSTRHAVRGGTGLVYLLLSLFFCLIVAHSVLTPIEQLMLKEKKEGRTPRTEQVVGTLLEFGEDVVSWALARDAGDDEAAQERYDQEAEAWSAYLLHERPALLSVIFLILLFGMPLIIPLGAFNQTAGDIGNRGLRYLLLRTERANIYVGRFLSTSLFTLLVNAFSILTITLYVGLKLDIYGAGELSSWALMGLLALTVQSLPYVALCAWLSASNSSGMLSLFVCSLVIGGVVLVAFLAGKAWAPAGYLMWLMPWPLHNRLLHPEPGAVALAAGGCLLYAAGYLALGYRHFTRRDL